MPEPAPEPENAPPTQPPAERDIRGYRQKLVRWIARRLRSRDDAEDVTQEVFSRLRGLEVLTLAREPLAYLFGVAFNVIGERRIREAQEKVVSFDSDAVARAGESPENATPDELVEQLNQQKQLERALARLPKQYRTVLLLCKRDGMTYEEAAAATGLSVHTVEKYLVRARARLMALTWDR
jgi:RNA polymerase sigma-70 factor (ECF subfamily)